MKTVGYILILALCGIVILDTRPHEKMVQLEVKELKAFSVDTTKEVQQSKLTLDSLIYKVERNHRYLNNQLNSND